MIIDLDVRSVYGNIKMYPASPAAKLLAELKGTKTLEVHDLVIAGELAAATGCGFSVQFKGASPECDELCAEYRVARTRRLRAASEPVAPFVENRV